MWWCTLLINLVSEVCENDLSAVIMNFMNCCYELLQSSSLPSYSMNEGWLFSAKEKTDKQSF